MGTRHDLAKARADYIAAVRALDTALKRFDASGMPMDPGPYGGEPYPWTPTHWAIIEALPPAFAAVLETRRAWDQLRRRG